MAKNTGPAKTPVKKKTEFSTPASAAQDSPSKPAQTPHTNVGKGIIAKPTSGEASKEKVSSKPHPKKKPKEPLVNFEEMARTAEKTFAQEQLSAHEEAAPINADPTPAEGVNLHNIFLHEEIPSLYTVHITSELSPVAKVGGLADVVFGLTWELQIRGHNVEIILPKYNNMRYDHIYGLERCFEDLWVPWHNGAIHCTVYFGFVYGRKCYFIEPHSNDCFFERNKFYGDHDDVFRFAFFSRAAMEFLLKSGKRPDIIHCHDWQTGLVPVFQWEIYHRLGMHDSRVCYTIHNFKHQGVCGPQVLDAAGLHRHEYYYSKERLGDYNYPEAINLMKGGIVYSNFITTVSPTHAGEAKDKGQGFGLEPALHIHGGKYGGVLNGIDYEVWNPKTDCHIPVQYSSENIDQKYENKRALRERLLMADNEKPIIAFVGRLDPQKGLDLIRHALFYCVNHGAQFIMLGSSPDPSIDSYFWRLKGEINENPDSHIEIGFNEELAHLIYAGSDMMVVPSRFEPCGLTQLIAMRYGAVPLVRSVGGLADTVFDKDHADKPLDQRNGYVFHNDDYGGIESALSRAISCYYMYPDHFRNLMLNGMASDYSWNVPGQHYLNIYNYIRAK
ncbi:glycogen synthase [Cerasicoccus arenae]|uniref:Glycogen synthase n=1 Tax=Cerasicoccus arenae TaxID=424488 RepID=A0A8J3DKX4_9BACT|nr:glycogen synthase [Cerasicoccus arenae]MBK1857855.1 glycogen synthase [Cerasicoccus arenae]GHC13586.1 glycogen synthase [Cerasicoccus arenae]